MGGRALGRVTKRAEFQEFRRPDGKGRSGPIAASFVSQLDQDPPIRMAFAISKRCGGAVERNRLRRRLREAVSALSLPVGPGRYLIRVEPEATSLSYEEVIHSLGQAMNRASQTRKENHG
jgi:ribonuclease P protein component